MQSVSQNGIQCFLKDRYAVLEPELYQCTFSYKLLTARASKSEWYNMRVPSGGTTDVIVLSKTDGIRGKLI